MIKCPLARHEVSATTTFSFLKVGYGGLSMGSILTVATWNISINTQVRSKIFQILGFYDNLYNISNVSFGVNFPLIQGRGILLCG